MLSTMTKNKTTFKLLCVNHKVCEEVTKTLQGMGFGDFQDLEKLSSSYDILAKHKVRGSVFTPNLPP